MLNASGLNDDEFLIWGHDNQFEFAIDTSDVPAGGDPVDSRFERVWRASEANVAGTAVDVGGVVEEVLPASRVGLDPIEGKATVPERQPAAGGGRDRRLRHGHRSKRRSMRGARHDAQVARALPAGSGPGRS